MSERDMKDYIKKAMVELDSARKLFPRDTATLRMKDGRLYVTLYYGKVDTADVDNWITEDMKDPNDYIMNNIEVI